MWRRKWQPTPVFLPGESQGWGSLVGCHLWGRTESDMTSDLAAAAIIIWKFNTPDTIDISRQKINKEIAVLNENKSTTFQNLWNAAEPILRGKLMQNRPVSRNKKNFNKTLTYHH